MDDESGEERDFEAELTTARGMILKGEYSHGVRHLGFAASLDPTHPDVEDLLGVVLDDLGELAPDTIEPSRPDGLWAGEAALRAWFLFGLGRGDEAVQLLLNVIGSDPERRWAAWLAQWLEEDPSLPVPADALLHVCRILLGPVLHEAPSATYADTLADMATAVARVLEAEPEHGPLLSVGSGLARRVGRMDEAVAWATEGDRIDGTLLSACMLGQVHRAAGDERAAFKAFEIASERDATDPSPRLDAADSLANVGEWAEAATWAKSAWDLAPELGTAGARTLYARYRATGEPRHALELFDWLEARADVEDEGPDGLGDARSIADGLAARLPWTGYLPLPRNAVLNLAGHLRQVAAEQPRGPLAVTVPRPESPSALLALEVAVGRPLKVTTAEVPEPDPRLPRKRVRTLSWRLYDDHLAPAVPPPTDRALGTIEFTPSRWYRWATAVTDGQALAASSGTINDLVSLLLYPGAGPAGVAPWDWIRRWQVVCCIALAERDAFDVLCDLADGPEDWVCDAALAGLVYLAGRRADLREKVVLFNTEHLIESYNRLASLDLPHFGSECDLYELLPDRPDDEAAAVRDLKREWEGAAALSSND